MKKNNTVWLKVKIIKRILTLHLLCLGLAFVQTSFIQQKNLNTAHSFGIMPLAVGTVNKRQEIWPEISRFQKCGEERLSSAWLCQAQRKRTRPINLVGMVLEPGWQHINVKWQLEVRLRTGAGQACTTRILFWQTVQS